MFEMEMKYQGHGVYNLIGSIRTKIPEKIATDMEVETGRNVAQVPGKYAVCLNSGEDSLVILTYRSKMRAVLGHIQCVNNILKNGCVGKIDDPFAVMNEG